MKATFRDDVFYTKKKLFWIVFLFLITLKTHRTFIGQGDEPHYILMTESLYLDHDVDVKNNIVSPYLWDQTPGDHHAIMRPDGKERPMSPPGLPLIATPVYAFAHSIIKVGMRLGHFQEKVERRIFIKNVFSTTMMAVAALFATFLFQIFNSISENRKLAWLLTLLFMLTPPLLPYGLVFYPDMPSAIITMALFWRLYERKSLDGFAFVLLNFLAWLHPRNSFVSVLLFFYFLYWPTDEKPRISNLFKPQNIRWALLYALNWIAVLTYNYVLWGNISLAGYYQYIHIKSYDPAYLPVAIPALFLDRSFGLLMLNPLYIFSFGGLAILFRENKRAAVIILSTIAIYLAIVSGYVYWWGGWSPVCRYLVPILPLLAFLSTIAIIRLWARKEWRAVFKTLFAAMGVVSLLYWQRPKLLWNFDDGNNQFLLHWLGHVGKSFQELLPNFFLASPAPQAVASLYVTAFIVINYLAVRDHRSLNATK